jgi:hypothetical protein
MNIPGTVSIIEGDGVYLQDVNGQNSSKTLSAGKLKELNLLSVDTTNHSITEEFIVENTSPSNNPTVIDACDSANGWVYFYGTTSGTGITSENGRIKIVGTTDANGRLVIRKNNIHFNAGGNIFLSCSIQSHLPGLAFIFYSTNGSNYIKKDIPFSSTSELRYVLPVKAPTGLVGTLDMADINDIRLGVTIPGLPGTEITIYLDNITADTAKTATLELQTPNNLAATSAIIQCYSDSTYSECRRDSLDGTYANISSTPESMKLLDGTKFDDVYGSGLGRAYFPKGSSGETKAGSSGNITYSENKGTSKRIGLKVDLPPSDGGRTEFNKIRLKVITYYTVDAEGNYSASYDFADSTNTSYGLQNLSKPWIALYDPTSNLIDFYLFTYRPKNLEFKRDESGTIHELKLFPGNGQLYHGRVTHCNPALDSDSNNIPDCLEASIEGSITKFLQSYGMVE